MRKRGIKATELIKILQEMVRQHGDQEVISGLHDYPTGVSNAYKQPDDLDPYAPKNSFVIY